MWTGAISQRGPICPNRTFQTVGSRSVLIEGELEAISFNGRPEPRWQSRVFPGLVGRPVNLREIEQGLDVIRSMPGYRAEMELEPDEAAGASVLAVTAETDRVWQFRATANNHGVENEEPGQTVATGQYIVSLEGTASHLLGVNETWSAQISSSFRETPADLFRDGPGTHNAQIGLSLPNGPWLRDVSLAWSSYDTVTPGGVGVVDISGWTRSVTIGTERLLHRDQDGRTYAGLSLRRYEAENRIAGVVIAASSRVTSALRLQARHDRVLWGGQFNGTIGFEQGLRLFGAEDGDLQPAGLPDPQYSLVDLSLSFARPVAVEHGDLIWEARLSAQYSADRLYGSEQFGLGGASTVRGTREQLVAGSSGAFLRNELRWTLPTSLPSGLGQLQLYGGLDLGWVASQDEIGVLGGPASGAAVGLRTYGGPLTFDLSYGQVLNTPNGVERPENVILLSAGLQF